MTYKYSYNKYFYNKYKFYKNIINYNYEYGFNTWYNINNNFYSLYENRFL